MAAQIPKKQAALKELKEKYGDKVLGEVTVEQCIGGGRDVKSLYYETSLLDSEEGIRFRGYTIPSFLPKVGWQALLTDPIICMA